MSKRFTDDSKWGKTWFRKLSPIEKCFWNYICDNCEYGFWEVDFETASYFIGQEINEQEIREKFSKQFIELSNGKIWVLVDYVEFQYGELSEYCKPHKPVVEKIKKIFIVNTENVDFSNWMKRVLKGYTKGINTLEDKEKDKEKEKEEEGRIVKETKFDFDGVWKRYPNKDGKKDAERHFHASVKSEKDYLDINMALDNYLKSERVFNGYIKNGSTFFNGWRDWIEYKEIVCSKCRGKGKYVSATGYEIICDCPKGKK